jgi:hypothetical protein
MTSRLENVFKKRYFLPTEHGSWIWLIGPLLIGAAAAGEYTPDLLWLSLAMLAAFLFRQPAAMLVKTFSGRRPVTERVPVLVWGSLYALVVLIGFTVLLVRNHLILLYLAIPGVPVFVWHLWLVSRRAERGQRGIEIVGAGVLALAAPAAYWVGGGTDNRLAWILWGIAWLQSAASIVFVYLRLNQRKQDAPGDLQNRIAAGLRVFAYHIFNLALAVYLYALGFIPLLVPLAFGLMLLDALEGILQPAIGTRPTRIGIRQLIMSGLFVILTVAGFLVFNT